MQRWNLPDGWVISRKPAHMALVSEADFIAPKTSAPPAAHRQTVTWLDRGSDGTCCLGC